MSVPGAVTASTEASDQGSTAIVPPGDAQVVKTKDEAAVEAAELERKKAEEEQKAKAAQQEQERLLAVAKKSRKAMLYGLLTKLITNARGARGIIHELWAYLRPQVFFWILVTYSPATVFTNCTINVTHTEIPAGVPIASDVIKVLIRNGAAANVEQAAVRVLEQARAYAAMRHGCCYS